MLPKRFRSHSEPGKSSVAPASPSEPRQRSIDKDLLSRNFPLSSYNSIHVTELCTELWAGFALALSSCEPQGTVSWEKQTCARQLRLQGKAGR